MKVCTEMKDLLRSLSDTEPGHRPELAQVAKVTIQHYVFLSYIFFKNNCLDILLILIDQMHFNQDSKPSSSH